MRDLFGFKNQSAVYNVFRPRYPDKLVEYVVGSVTSASNRSSECVLDVACGTGLFSRRLAPSFGTVVGIDQSESQLDAARESSQNFASVKYLKHDGYDPVGALEHFGIPKENVYLVTIAQGFHWFDFDKFLTSFNSSFNVGTTLSLVGYTRQNLVTQETIETPEIYDTIINKDMLKHCYDPKFKIFAQAMDKYYDSILPYFEFDRNILEGCYQKLPFDRYFKHREFEKFAEVSRVTLFHIQQYMFSISAYNVCVEKNADVIERGEFSDPLVKFLKTVLEYEGKLELTNSPNLTSSEDAEILKTVELDTKWNFFVWILRN